MKNDQLKYSLLLFFGTFIWGSAFVAQSAGTTYIGPYTFSAVRCAIGALTVLTILLLESSRKNESAKALIKAAIKPGLLCGVSHAAAVIIQQVGIFYVGNDTARAGFLTALYLVIVPVLGLLFRRKVKWNMWIGIVLGIGGMYVMCMLGENGSMTIGDALLIACSFFYAVQILLLDKFAPGLDPFALSFVEYCVTTTASAVFMVIFEEPTIDGIMNSWIPLLYCGILSMGIASTIQTVSQRVIHPAVASLIMSLESVISLICGWVYFGSMLSGNEWAGCALVFAGVLVSQLDLFIKNKKTKET